MQRNSQLGDLLRWLRRALAGLSVLILACGDTGLPAGDGGDARNPGNNRAPIINPVAPKTVEEGERLEIVLAVDDPDGDSLFLEAEPLPDGADFDAVQGTLVYEPDFSLVSREEGSLVLPDIVVQVDDRENPFDPAVLSDSTTVSITVVDVNRVPFFLSSDGLRLTELEAQVEPATEARVRFQVIDPDGDEVALSLVESPAYVRLDGQALVLSPTEADRGSVASFMLGASDGRETVSLPVRVVVGDLEAELPAPTGLVQGNADGDLAVGSSTYEGLFVFGADAHAFDIGPLRLQAEVAELGQDYADGKRAIGDPVEAGVAPQVQLELEGGAAYRWRARFLSDEFGASPYTSFGANAETDPDLDVEIIPDTVLDGVPHDPGPIDVTFAFYSANVSDFECQLDGGATVDCNTRVTCCPGGDCGDRTECEDDGCTCAQHTYTGLDEGAHTFTVQGVTRDGLPDPTPEAFEWEVLDVPEPTTTLSGTPATPVGCSAQFGFDSNDTSATFECRLDREGSGSFTGDWAPCTSPKIYSGGLLTGSYRFFVRAVNLVGVPDSTPEEHAFSTTCAE